MTSSEALNLIKEMLKSIVSPIYKEALEVAVKVMEVKPCLCGNLVKCFCVKCGGYVETQRV